MKKLTMILGLAAMITVASCKKETEETPAVEVAPVETPAPVETTTTTETTTEVEEDGTSISVGNDGVDISTKDGKNKTEVKVGDGDAKVEIKK